MKALGRINTKNAPRLVSEAAGNAKQTMHVTRQSTRRSSSLRCVERRRYAGSSKPRQDMAKSLTFGQDGLARRTFSLATDTGEEASASIPEGSYSTETAQEASATTPEKEKLLTYEDARELTKILNEPAFHKLGAFTATTWKSIGHLIKSWAFLGTGESVEASFNFLERLILEQELLLQNRSSIKAARGVVQDMVEGSEREELQQLSRDILHTDLLNAVIKNWRFCWKTRETDTSPRALLPLLEEYIDRSPSLHPNTKTYNMIMDAATRRFGKAPSEKLAEEIFHRMSSQSSLAKKPTFEMSPAPVLNSRLRSINDISPDQYTYTTLINVYAYSKNPKAAEELLLRYINDFLNGRTETQPPIHAFAGCITAWARSELPNAPEKAESIIDLMSHLDKQPPCQNIEPSVITYNALMDCWAKSGRVNAGERALTILNTIRSTPGLMPDNVSYNTVIHACIQAAEDTVLAEKVLYRMDQRHLQMRQESPKPDRDSYMLILRGLNNHCEKDKFAAPKAEQYLQRMAKAGYQPDLQAYNCVLACWARSTLERKGECAERILIRMQDPPRELRIAPVEPNTLSYNSVITAYAGNGQARQAESWFWAMYEVSSGGERKVQPQTRTFNTVLSAWKNAPGLSNTKRLRAMIDLLDKVPKSGPLALKPDTVSCNILLHLLAEVGSEESRHYAARMLDELEREYEESKDESRRPNVYTYSCVMRAHANVGDLDATRKVLFRMQEDFKHGNEKARPDIVSFNHMLLAIARGSRGRNLGAGKLADKVFQQVHDLHAAGIMEELPNKKSYDIKINCWATSGSKHAGEEADRIIQEMERKAANGFPDLQPDMMSFSTAIKAHAACGNHSAAEANLNRMLQEYAEGNEKMKPGLRTFNTVLSAFAKANDAEAAEKAETYLREMLLYQEFNKLDLKPDVVTFTAVISAWANSGDPRAGERAGSLFREIEDLSREGGNKIRLDSGFYRSVIHACAVSGDTATAEALIETINNKELKNVKADRYMYHSLLQAHANSGDKDAGEKAEAILKQMDDIAMREGYSFVKPHSDCYMRVLECWANSEDSEKAVERSEALLLEMEKRAERDSQLKPTPAAYSRVINTMARAGNMTKTKALLKRMYDNSGKCSGVEAFVSA